MKNSLPSLYRARTGRTKALLAVAALRSAPPAVLAAFAYSPGAAVALNEAMQLHEALIERQRTVIALPVKGKV